MNKYKFFLIAVHHYPKYRELKKNLIITASNLCAAYKQIELNYPDWQISMFWPIEEKKVKQFSLMDSVRESLRYFPPQLKVI